ncbi:MAG: YybS family protein [Actinobacteria bacterium]|nr:YybS family protein [Actinomycetota bacterium]
MADTADKGAVFKVAGKALAASIALGIVIAFLPLLSLIAIPAILVPAALVTHRYGILAGMAVSLIAGAVCLALTGVYAGMLILLLAALAGTGAGIALRRGVSQFRLFMVTAGLLFVVLFLWLGAVLLISGQGPVSAMQSLADQNADSSRQIYQAMGMSQQDIDATLQGVSDFATALPYLAPAVLLVVSLVFSGAFIAIGRRVFEKAGTPFPQDFVFREMRVHWAFAYATIAGFVCLIYAYTVDGTGAEVVYLIGMNLLIASGVMFFVQGLSVVSFLVWHFKLSRGKRAGIYACVVVLEAFFYTTSLLGLFDIWFDFRRRLIGRKAAGH